MDRTILIDDRIACRGQSASQADGLVQRLAMLFEGDDANASARVIVPESGSSVPASNRSSVVLPLPLGPRRPSRCPGPRSRSRFVTTGISLKLLVTFCATTSCLDFRPEAEKSMPTVDCVARASAWFNSSMSFPADWIGPWLWSCGL